MADTVYSVCTLGLLLHYTQQTKTDERSGGRGMNYKWLSFLMNPFWIGKKQDEHLLELSSYMYIYIVCLFLQAAAIQLQRLDHNALPPVCAQFVVTLWSLLTLFAPVRHVLPFTIYDIL